MNANTDEQFARMTKTSETLRQSLDGVDCAVHVTVHPGDYKHLCHAAGFYFYYSIRLNGSLVISFQKILKIK